MYQGWGEIRRKARAFSLTWEGETYEKGESQSFYNDFFEIFGVSRRSVAVFESRAKKLSGNNGFIDVFMPKVLLAEHKSRGKNLDAAIEQAEDYFLGLKESERPALLLACDFQTFRLIDLEERDETTFHLNELDKYVERFAAIMGQEKRIYADQLPVNVKAAELIGNLHDKLLAPSFKGTDLERFLVRTVFCLFADDTNIFGERNLFLRWLETRTHEDGHDLGPKLRELYEILDQPIEERSPHLEESLTDFPYINGALFKGQTQTPQFNRAMREALIEACIFDWSPISPAIFGSLFQSVMDKKKRREAGAHYTSEKNILKVIQPLFMDELWAEFETITQRKRDRAKRLKSLQIRLGGIKIIDPACGCGNFLIIAYREIRRLEIEILKELYPDRQLDLEMDVTKLSLIDVDQFFGIEYEEFSAEIAKTTMWMMDHILNIELSRAFGIPFARIPLNASASILYGDALEANWGTLLPHSDATYIIGNPPFVGHQWRTKEQKAGMHMVWGKKGKVNRLDYVTAWFRKAVDYMHMNPQVKTAFVSTNSITQGEQAGILWSWMFQQGVSISFAHRTFQWNSDARGKAAVHCVIVGFQLHAPQNVKIFEYADIRGEPYESKVSRLNGYLTDGPDYTVPSRTRAPADRPKLNKGSQPTDGTRFWKRKWKEDGLEETQGSFPGNLILNDEQREALILKEPTLEPWIRRYVGGDELISGDTRWCLWLKNTPPNLIRTSKALKPHLQRVRDWRKDESPTESVNEFAKYPTLFTQDRQPETRYLGLPEVSSENREYIPMAFLNKKIIASNKLQIIEDAPLWVFGLITSAMHMAWMRTVAGRLESRYSYAPAVYNSFPFPKLNEQKKSDIINAAQNIIDIRATFSEFTLEDLYDRDAMPPSLTSAHTDLDRLVDRLYKRGGFRFERQRVEHLFMLLTERDAPLAK